jgi:hypothetical protein
LEKRSSICIVAQSRHFTKKKFQPYLHGFLALTGNSKALRRPALNWPEANGPGRRCRSQIVDIFTACRLPTRLSSQHQNTTALAGLGVECVGGPVKSGVTACRANEAVKVLSLQATAQILIWQEQLHVQIDATC